MAVENPFLKGQVLPRGLEPELTRPCQLTARPTLLRRLARGVPLAYLALKLASCGGEVYNPVNNKDEDQLKNLDSGQDFTINIGGGPPIDPPGAVPDYCDSPGGKDDTEQCP